MENKLLLTGEVVAKRKRRKLQDNETSPGELLALLGGWPLSVCVLLSPSGKHRISVIIQLGLELAIYTDCRANTFHLSIESSKHSLLKVGLIGILLEG